jgi:type IV pilus assembly protein PilM
MQNSKIWTIIKNKLIKRTEKLLGIDIGTGSLKIIEINLQPQRPVITKLACAEFQETFFEDGRLIKPEELAGVLRQLLNTHGFSSREAVVAVGGRAIFIREVAFPQMTESELREAIKWDMEKYVPYAPESFYYDFSVIGDSENGLEMRVLLVAAPKHHIDGLVGMLKQAGVRPVAIDGEAFALQRSLIKAENAVLVDIGKYMSQLIVYQEGIPTVTRIIPLAGQRFTEAVMGTLELEESEAERLKERQKGLLPPTTNTIQSEIHEQMLLLVEELAREIRRTVEFYQIQNKEAVIEKVLLTGGGANLDNLIEQLNIMLDIPLSLHCPTERVEYSAAYDAQYIKSIAPRLSVAIGLALRGGQA